MFLIEKAKNSIPTCVVPECKIKIKKGEILMGIVAEGGKRKDVVHWKHFSCSSKTELQAIINIEIVDGFKKLPKADQKKVRKYWLEANCEDVALAKELSENVQKIDKEPELSESEESTRIWGFIKRSAESLLSSKSKSQSELQNNEPYDSDGSLVESESEVEMADSAIDEEEISDMNQDDQQNLEIGTESVEAYSDSESETEETKSKKVDNVVAQSTLLEDPRGKIKGNNSRPVKVLRSISEFSRSPTKHTSRQFEEFGKPKVSSQSSNNQIRKEAKKSLGLFNLEYAKTSRSKCTAKCEEPMIEKGSLRIGIAKKFYHLNCLNADQKEFIRDIENVKGYDGLELCDKESLRKWIRYELTQDAVISDLGECENEPLMAKRQLKKSQKINRTKNIPLSPTYSDNELKSKTSKTPKKSKSKSSQRNVMASPPNEVSY